LKNFFPIFSSYFLAIKKVFLSSKNNKSTGHKTQGIRRRFAFLNRGNIRGKKAIYTKIIHLPFSEETSTFEDDLTEILKSQYLTVENKKYMETKALFK